jgi:hypothetical protein
MVEMSPLMVELLETLQQAQKAVEAELDQHASAGPSDPAPLLNLHQSVEEFRDQAVTLVHMMRHQDAETTLADEVEDLASYFEGTERRILALLEAGRG